MVIIRAASRLCYPHCIYLYIPRKSSKLMLCCFCYCSKGSLHTPLLCVVGKYVVHCIFLSDMQKLCPELLPIWFQLPSWLEVNKDKNFDPNLCQKVLESPRFFECQHMVTYPTWKFQRNQPSSQQIEWRIQGLEETQPRFRDSVKSKSQNH